MIYTSGSTGRPKGVLLSVCTLVNLLLWQQSEVGEDASRRILQFASLNFDASFQEIFFALCFGGSVHLIAEDRRKDMQELLQDIISQQINYLFIPYVVLKNLSEYVAESGIYPESLSTIFTAGEQLKLNEDIRLMVRRSGCSLVNYYGPSETHVVTWYTVEENDYASRPLAPIGVAVSNTSLYVLDPYRELCGLGIPGELYIGGVQVGIGYLNQPALTADRFIKDRFSDEPGARLYKTGDKVRWLEDGNLEFLGRFDDQVKIRGNRVEMGEVETVLEQSGFVKQSVVVVNTDEQGYKRLIGYVVPLPGYDRDKEVMPFLQQQLPDYMIPSVLIVVESLPLTNNGKVNKRLLPKVEKHHMTRQAFTAPRNELEEKLSRIWETLLKVEQISIYDNFFDLGGHSLLVTRVITAVHKAFDIKLEVKEMFASPTIAGLSEKLAAIIALTEEPVTLNVDDNSESFFI
jgi:acyl-coenzyme A synthetase/AMP-(fatty) acid ligase/acyl carrier protein